MNATVADQNDRFLPEILKVLPADAKVIVEIGCGAGALGLRHKPINPECRFFGVEAEPKLAAIAASRLDAVTSRIEDLPIAQGEVDCIVLSQVLSHDTDLTSTLQHYSQWLKPDGQLIAHVPNMHYWQRIMRLITNKWESEPEFLMSPTQLHFLTPESIRLAFTQAGLHIYEIQTDYPAMSQEQVQQFESFREAIAPLLQYLGVQAENFKMMSRSIAFIVRTTKTPISKRLIVQTFITAPAGCDRVRVLEPDRFSATIPGTRAISADIKKNESLSFSTPFLDEEKVLIWQRALLLYPQDIQKQKAILNNGYLIVAEHDDDPYLWPENADNKYLLFLSSHCVQTSTAPLAEHLKQFNPNVQYFPNQLAFLPPERSYSNISSKGGFGSNHNQITLFFGALNRQNDWEPIMPALNRVLKKHKQVQVKVIYDQQFFDALETKQKQFQPWCPYEQYQATLRTCDIGVLPLNDTQFNRMKSDLKFLEHAGHGVAALASPTVYASSIVEGETGLIYRSSEEFEGQLTELILNSDMRQRIAKNAYKWVKENRLLCQHYRARREWYLEMRSQLPRLNAELRDRCPQMFD